MQVTLTWCHVMHFYAWNKDGQIDTLLISRRNSHKSDALNSPALWHKAYTTSSLEDKAFYWLSSTLYVSTKQEVTLFKVNVW